MARQYKKDGLRKGDILDVAQSLFAEKGYGATSIEAVIEKAGISKGAFYYYFESKEDLVDELVARMAWQISAALERIADDPNLSVFEKLRKTHEASRSIKISNKELLKVYLRLLYQQNNEKLRTRMTAQVHAISVPFYTKIIGQGVAEGVFNAPSPEFSADMIVQMQMGLMDRLWRLFIEMDEHPEHAQKLDKIVDLYEDACERLLGAPRGSLDIVKESDFHAFRDGIAGRAAE
jgi:AcrR family transcriptional regulator